MPALLALAALAAPAAGRADPMASACADLKRQAESGDGAFAERARKTYEMSCLKPGERPAARPGAGAEAAGGGRRSEAAAGGDSGAPQGDAARCVREVRRWADGWRYLRYRNDCDRPVTLRYDNGAKVVSETADARGTLDLSSDGIDGKAVWPRVLEVCFGERCARH